ncbi:MAG: sensor histidine kinase KdpD, partial [Marmoricola sp.]|nr:sensor histidine kinase KdpD [Marmoricola sp.]
RPVARSLGPHRTAYGFLLAVLLPALAGVALVPLRGPVNLVSDLLLFLLATVVVALVGGLRPALVCAVAGSLVINYFFTPPLHTLAVKDPNDALALFVFLAVAMLVSSVVDLAARRTDQVGQAEAETDALAQVDRTRTALLAAVGHDLRTPLAAAKASVSTLRSPDLVLSDEDRAELVETAEVSLDRLAGLVENLLDMSRLQAGAMAVHLRPAALDEVVARALDDVGRGAADVRVELPDDLPPALVDPGLLERILVNVVANALRFSPADRPPRLLGAAVSADAGDVVELRLVDRGPGIPPDRRDEVFAPFQRLGDTDNSTGVGLGLALSRGLAEAMGGGLDVEDTPEGGLTMVMRFPRAEDPHETLRPGLRERALPHEERA